MRERLGARQHGVTRNRATRRKQVITDHANLDHPRRAFVRFVERNKERQRLYQMWCVGKEAFTLAQRLAHQIEFGVL